MRTPSRVYHLGARTSPSAKMAGETTALPDVGEDDRAPRGAAKLTDLSAPSLQRYEINPETTAGSFEIERVIRQKRKPARQNPEYILVILLKSCTFASCIFF